MGLYWFVHLMSILAPFVWGTPTNSLEDNSVVSQGHIAFVFAGGVRSFLLPSTHQSIRYNLIHAFCPPNSCTGDVFVRLSIADNNHDGFDADGRTVPADESKKKAAIDCLQHLKHESTSSKLVYELVDIGSAQESQEMDAVTSTNMKKKIYRTLDSRRFSMYFNRWAAYSLMLKSEKDSGKQYDWVVHARLDMGWGAPIRPYTAWSPMKMYVPDSWYMDIPDTFALLPRKNSDIYFSIDTLYDPPSVMCLGGPNLNRRSMETDALIKRGFNHEEIKLAQGEDCFNKVVVQHHTVTHERATNHTWIDAGVSEVILKRKLEYYQLSRDHKTIGFSSFFMFITRLPILTLCFYIEPAKFIPWVKEYQHLSVPTGTACNVMWVDFVARERNQGINCDVETFRSKVPLVDKPMQTCMLDKAMTDWNFLPFRLRRKGDLCLTASQHPVTSEDQKRTQVLQMSSCVDTVKWKGNQEFTGDYTEAQLFHMYPLSPLPQRISVWDFGDGVNVLGMRCLTVSSSLALQPLTNISIPRPIVELGPCSGNPDEASQLFRIKISPTKIGAKGTGVSGLATNCTDASTGLTKPGCLKGANQFAQLLPDKVVATIQWYGSSPHSPLCLAHQEIQTLATTAGKDEGEEMPNAPTAPKNVVPFGFLSTTGAPPKEIAAGLASLKSIEIGPPSHRIVRYDSIDSLARARDKDREVVAPRTQVVAVLEPCSAPVAHGQPFHGILQQKQNQQPRQGRALSSRGAQAQDKSRASDQGPLPLPPKTHRLGHQNHLQSLHQSTSRASKSSKKIAFILERSQIKSPTK